MQRQIKTIILFIFLLAACSPAPTPTAAPVALKDGFNRSVILPPAAKKIVSLAPSNTEILFAIGAGPQVIGRDEFSDYPAEAKKVASVGGSMGKYNFEQIAALIARQRAIIHTIKRKPVCMEPHLE